MLLELELVEPSLGWRQLDGTTRTRQQREFALGRRVSAGAARAWSALASTPIAPRWRRCMRPRPRTWTATSAAGTPVKNCTLPTSPWAHTSTTSTPSRMHHRPGSVHGEQAEAEPDQQRQVGDQQRRMQVDQRRDLDLKARHRLL